MLRSKILPLVFMASFSGIASASECMDRLCGNLPGSEQEACYRNYSYQQQCTVSTGLTGQYVKDVEYKGVATYNNGSSIYTYSESIESYFKPLTARAKATLAQMDAAGTALRTAFYDQLSQNARDEKGSLRSFTFSFARPQNGLKVTIEPTGSSGGATITFSSFDLDMYAYMKRSEWYGTVWKTTIRVDSGPVSFKGDYNIYTGQATNVQPVNFNPKISVDVDSNFVFKLFKGFSSEREKIRSEMDTALRGAFAAVSQNTNSFIGLDQALPNGALNFAGIDVGREIREALTNIGANEKLVVDLLPVKKTYLVHDMLGSRTYKSAKVVVKYNNDYSLTVTPVPIIGSAALRQSSGGGYLPPSDQDAPNTNAGNGTLSVVAAPAVQVCPVWSITYNSSNTTGEAEGRAAYSNCGSCGYSYTYSGGGITTISCNR